LNNAVSIIGAGGWGTTLAVVLARKGIDVKLHSVFREHNLQMKKENQNRLFLKGVRFPSHINVSLSLEDALDSRVIIIAIPVKFIREFLKKIAKQKAPVKNKIFVSVSKGIESASLKRVSQIMREVLGPVEIAVLSGPNIAKEVLAGVPSASVIACNRARVAQKLQALLSTQTFRIYHHHDIAGVELGGALKNIIAIACGLSDGLGFGTNTKAALVTRGLVEITRLGTKMGAHPQTFWGVSGLGDLVTTCFSPHSRNRFVGEEIGKGKSLTKVIKNMQMVAEGVETVKPAYILSKKLKVDMPITKEVYCVLYKNKPPRQAVADLMGRPLKREMVSLKKL